MIVHQTILPNKINTREAGMAVIGLDYAGLPLAARFARAILQTVGLDLDPGHAFDPATTAKPVAVKAVVI